MMEIIAEMLHTLIALLASPFNHGMMQFALKFIPYVLFLELLLYIFIILGIIRYFIRKDDEIPEEKNYYPKVSCIVTCYSEGKDVALTIRSLTEQIYPGVIEIIPIVDGAVQNKEIESLACRA